MKLKCLSNLNAIIESPINFEFGGVQFKFTAHIKLVEDDVITKLTSASGVTDPKIVRELLIGWDNFVDDGIDVKFSNDVLEQLLCYGAIAGKLSVECINAQYRVQEKN